MEGLGIDLKLMIAQVINFVLFFLIFKKYLAKPFAKFLDEEQKKQQAKEKMEQYLKDEEEKMKKNLEKQKKELEKKYDEAILKAKNEAKAYKEKLIAQAKKEAEEIIANARKKIEVEKKAAEKELNKKVIELSSMILEKTLHEELDEKKQKEINERLLKNLKITN